MKIFSYITTIVTIIVMMGVGGYVFLLAVDSAWGIDTFFPREKPVHTWWGVIRLILVAIVMVAGGIKLLVGGTLTLQRKLDKE